MSRDLMAAQKRLTEKVMGRPGVTGTAIGEKGGKPCLIVYTSGDADVPKRMGGVPVVVEKSGTFRKL